MSSNLIEISSQDQDRALQLLYQEQENKRLKAQATEAKERKLQQDAEFNKRVKEYYKENWHPCVTFFQMTFSVIACVSIIAFVVSVIGLWVCGTQTYCPDGSTPHDGGGDHFQDFCGNDPAPSRHCTLYGNWIWSIIGCVSASALFCLFACFCNLPCFNRGLSKPLRQNLSTV